MKQQQKIKSVVKDKGGSHERVVNTHPAFGTCTVVRTSGAARLFNSEFRHQHYLTLKIHTAEQHRHLSRNWIHSRQTLVEVSFSESQWATMLSSIGVGEGTPCTLQRMAGKSLPRIEGGESAKQQHIDEMAAHMVEVHQRIGELETLVASAKMTNKLRSALLSGVSNIATAAGSNLKFVANSFTKHMENVTEEAKIEISSYAQQAQAGINPTDLQLLEGDTVHAVAQDKPEPDMNFMDGGS